MHSLGGSRMMALLSHGEHGAGLEVRPLELSPPRQGLRLTGCTIMALLYLLLHFASVRRTCLKGT